MLQFNAKRLFLRNAHKKKEITFNVLPKREATCFFLKYTEVLSQNFKHTRKRILKCVCAIVKFQCVNSSDLKICYPTNRILNVKKVREKGKKGDHYLYLKKECFY